MEILRTGIILFTEKYEECVAFCRNAVGLQILLAKDELTVFDFGGSYLMVERGGSAEPAGKTKAHNPTCFRLNVADVKHYMEQLQQAGVTANYQEYPWGTVARFYDPDGNLWALRDEQSFAAHLAGGENQE